MKKYIIICSFFISSFVLKVAAETERDLMVLLHKKPLHSAIKLEALLKRAKIDDLERIQNTFNIEVLPYLRALEVLLSVSKQGTSELGNQLDQTSEDDPTTKKSIKREFFIWDELAKFSENAISDIRSHISQTQLIELKTKISQDLKELESQSSQLEEILKAIDIPQDSGSNVATETNATSQPPIQQGSPSVNKLPSNQPLSLSSSIQPPAVSTPPQSSASPLPSLPPLTQAPQSHKITPMPTPQTPSPAPSIPVPAAPIPTPQTPIASSTPAMPSAPAAPSMPTAPMPPK